MPLPRFRLIDLSVPLVSHSKSEPMPAEIRYITHDGEGLAQMQGLFGIQPPGASWGIMINAGRGYLQQAPWIVFWPGTALFVTVVGLNFVGDAVREALDPRLRK